MSIRLKLLVSFLFLTLLILVMFVVRQYFSVQETNLVRELVLDHEISAQLSGLSTAAQKIRRYEKEFFIYVQNEKKRTNYAGEFSEASREIIRYLDRLKTLYANNGRSSELTTLAEWESATEFYIGGFNKLYQRVESGEITGVIEANGQIQQYKNRFRVVLSGAADAITKQYRSASARADQIRQYQDTSSLIFMIIAAASLSVAIVMSWRVPAAIVKPIRQMTEIANAISKGKVNNEVDVRGSAEIEDLAKSIKRLQLATLGLLKRLQSTRKQQARTG